MSWRIASVPYLNALPLVYGLEGPVEFCPPAVLADRLHQREFDAGLAPIAEALRHDQYELVDGVAIASRGPVFSVLLTHRGPVSALRRVAVDAASRTSAWLARVILKERYDCAPEFYPCPSQVNPTEHEAVVLIGDQAIRYQLRNGSQPVVDLGEAWWELTGLPFVYAAWTAQRPVAAGLAARLRQAKAEGLAHLEEIVQDAREFSPAFRREYLTRYVTFELGAAEKAGIQRFQQSLGNLGLIERCHDLRYIA